MSQQYSGGFVAAAFACLYCLVLHESFDLQTVAVLTVDYGDEVPLSMQSHRISTFFFYPSSSSSTRSLEQICWTKRTIAFDICFIGKCVLWVLFVQNLLSLHVSLKQREAYSECGPNISMILEKPSE